MLYFIAVWTLLSMVCGLTGAALLSSLRTSVFTRLGDRLMVALWLGVVLLATALLTASFIVPLSPLIGGLVAAIPVSLSLRSQRVRREISMLRSHLTPVLLTVGLTLAFGVAILTTQRVTWLDTGLYHYGAIRWLSEFGAVPGIALLLRQFGFSSTWFALAAPLNDVFLEGRASAVTNGFVLFLSSLHCLICLIRVFSKRSTTSDWFILFFQPVAVLGIFSTRLLSTVLISPSPDIPVIFLTGIVAWTILLNFASPADDQVKYAGFHTDVVPLILAIGATSIKLTALPLLFVASLFYFFCRGFSLQRLWIGSVVIILLLLPILSFGVITSGCPLYPSSVLCLDVPWAVTAEEAKATAEVTRGWGTWFGSPPPEVNSGVWLFWKWLNSINSSKLIVLLVGLSVLASVPIFKEYRAKQNFSYLWVLALAFVGSTFAISQAPLLRFGLGYFVLSPILLAAILIQSKFQLNLSKAANQLMPSLQFQKLQRQNLFVLLFLTTLIAVSLTSLEVRSRFLLPPPFADVEVLENQTNDVTYFSPRNSRGVCWDTELPCTGKPDEDIHLRNPNQGIEAGFSRRPNSL
ncbi:MAG: hypothetical protein HC840_02280 [Leptolyngbyaceae cyanobacterium RM2_2_4]|nr:hypothetical protein [Leptolyngbyaceae cyanobacterium RM2_2_4]